MSKRKTGERGVGNGKKNCTKEKKTALSGTRTSERNGPGTERVLNQKGASKGARQENGKKCK